MKSLSLSRPLVIMVVGMPGAGKSFFARQFSEMFGAPIISFDRLRFELYNKPKFTSEEQELITRLAEYQLDELLKTNRSFLVDGGCNTRVERQKIEQIAKRRGYGTLVIWVQTDELTAKKRATSRSSRRGDDKFNASLTADQFTQFAKRFAAPLREDHVVISGKHTYSTQAKMTLRKLAAPHTTEADRTYREQPKERQAVAQPRARQATRRNVVIR